MSVEVVAVVRFGSMATEQNVTRPLVGLGTMTIGIPLAFIVYCLAIGFYAGAVAWVVILAVAGVGSLVVFRRVLRSRDQVRSA
jgi:hypothetical protein